MTFDPQVHQDSSDQNEDQKPTDRPNKEDSGSSDDSANCSPDMSGEEQSSGDLVRVLHRLSLNCESSYSLSVQNGQRRFGVPVDEHTPRPSRGTELFLAKLPRDMLENDIFPVFRKIGRIFEIRLMMDHGGQNRGFGFVVYFNQADARRAVRQLDNTEIRPGKPIGVVRSVDNCRLFLGGIPKRLKKEDVIEEMRKITPELRNVIVYPSLHDKTKNRGFAFLEYASHKAAAGARKLLQSGHVQLWGHELAVDWAEPEPEIDDEVMQSVRVLYVRNLLLSTTEETICQLFSKYAEVERVKRIRDYAFVHLKTREGAVKCYQFLQGVTVDGSEVEISWAKPVDKESYRQQKTIQQLMKSYLTLGNDQLNFYRAYNGVSGQSLKRMLHNRGRTAAGSRAAGSRALLNDFIHPPNCFRPMLDIVPNHLLGYEHFYDIIPGYELAPTGQLFVRPMVPKNPVQLLDELAQRNGLGQPAYTLLTSSVSSSSTSTTTTTSSCSSSSVFSYKVTLPGSDTCFEQKKMHNTIEEAKIASAEYVLSQLNLSDSGPQSPLSPVPISPLSAPLSPTYQFSAVHPGAIHGCGGFARYVPAPAGMVSFALHSGEPTAMYTSMNGFFNAADQQHMVAPQY